MIILILIPDEISARGVLDKLCIDKDTKYLKLIRVM